MTWVISDYVAAQGSAELSVQKGQQVEVIDTNCLGAPDYCLVRLTNAPTNNNNVSATSLSSSSTQEQIIQEGLVPSSILKPPPTQTTKSRRAGDGDEGELVNGECSRSFTCYRDDWLLISCRCKYYGLGRTTELGKCRCEGAHKENVARRLFFLFAHEMYETRLSSVCM